MFLKFILKEKQNRKCENIVAKWLYGLKEKTEKKVCKTDLYGNVMVNG